MVTVPRSLGLTGAPNARDIGGYRTTRGMTVKYGQVFRTDALGKATAADVAKLSGIDPMAELKLRAPLLTF
jgi:protein-tyrosine phosphatase